MAAPSAFTIPNLAKLNINEGATGVLRNGSSNYRAVLITSAFTPNNTTNEVYATISGNELASGNGYTSGGVTLTNVALTNTAGVIKFTSDPIVWTASGSGIPAWRYCYIYYLGTLNSKVNPLIGYFIGDSAPADIPLTASPNTITVTPNASGFISAT